MPTLPPVNNAPASVSATEDTQFVFSSENDNAISISDGDSTTATVVLSIGFGTLAANLSGGATVDGQGTGNLTLTGTIEQINATLDGLTYTPAANDFGTRNLSITTVTDGVDVDAVVIEIASVNDTPVIYGNDSVSFNEGGTYTFNSSNSSVFSIDDVEDDNVTVTLVVGSGTLDVDTAAGATVIGDNSSVVILSGSITNVNAAIDEMVFTPSDSDFYGNVTLSMTVVDAGSPPGVASKQTTIIVNNVNDLPTLSHNTGATVNEGESTVIYGSNLAYDDIDDADGDLTYTIINAVDNGTLYLGEDSIGYGGTFTQDDLNYGNITYVHNGGETTTDSIAFVVRDGSNALPSGMDPTIGSTFTFSITPVNDAPVVSLSQTLRSFTENGSALVLDNSITITDSDNASLSGATVTIGYEANDFVTALVSLGEDTLTATTGMTNITASYSNGVLTLSGTDSKANYESVLESITYSNNSNDPSGVTRTITYVVSDGALDGDDSLSLNVFPVNDAPTITGDNAFTVNQGMDYTLSVADIYGYDPDDADQDLVFTMTSIQHGTLTVGEEGNDTLSFPQHNNVGVQFTLQDIEDGLVVYTHDNSYGNTVDTINVTFGDGDTTVSGAIVVTVKTKPQIDANDTVGYTEQGGPIALDSSLSLSDLDGDTITGATVSLWDGEIPMIPNFGEETLAAAVSLPGGITASYSNGVLTFSGAATKASYEEALETVSYNNSSDDPVESRTVIYSVTDNNGQVGEDTLTINITALNDAPTLESNNTIHVDEGGDITISTDDLDITDPDDDEDDIVYTLATAPIYGGLQKWDDEDEEYVDINYGGTFTQADIDYGNIRYEHSGGEDTIDFFSFTVSDGEDSIGAFTSTISVNAMNDLTELDLGVDSISTKQNTAVTIGDDTIEGSAFMLTDVDDDYFGVTLTGAHGTMTLENSLLGFPNQTVSNGFSIGDGENDSIVAIYGSTTYINNLLDVITFTPTNGFTGTAGITIKVDDDDDGLDTVGGSLSIRVTPPGSATGGGGGNTDTDTVTSGDDETLPGDKDFLVMTGDDDLNGTGNDNDNGMYGNNGNNGLSGDDGDDTIEGGGGADTVRGNNDDDNCYGNTGDDVVYGNRGDDTLYGGQDNDTVFGGQETDIVYGNQNTDVIYGNNGNDTMFGGQGDDTMYGGQGNDFIFGNLGNDQLIGGDGNDTLYAAGGSDTLTGGEGDDFIIISETSVSTTITDFSLEDDTLFVTFGSATGFVDDGNGNAVLTEGGITITVVGVDADALNLVYIQPLI